MGVVKMKLYKMSAILLVFTFGVSAVHANGFDSVHVSGAPSVYGNNTPSIHAITPSFAHANGPGTQSKYSFHITIKDEEDGNVYELTGLSEFTVTPSSYSVLLNGEQGRCGVHLLNFREPPGAGIYDVAQPDTVRTGVVCVLDVTEPVERMASHAGTFTISHIDGKNLTGELDIVLKGGITGKSFRLTGTVSSENLPLNLDF